MNKEKEKTLNSCLENVVDKYLQDVSPFDKEFTTHRLKEIVSTAFLSGAKWMREYLETDNEIIDREWFKYIQNSCLKEGAINGRAELMKHAVDGVIADNIDGTKDICLYPKRYGEKVSVVVLDEYGKEKVLTISSDYPKTLINDEDGK